MSILVVDDSPVARLHLQMQLAAAGFEDVVLSGSPREALERAAQDGTIDLILLDMVMPEMNGVEVCRRLKTHERLRDTPVIMVTAQTEVEHLAEAFAAGAMDYISKPAHEVELIARVRSALRLKAETDQRKAREREVRTQLDRALAAESALARANTALAEQAADLAAQLDQRLRAEASLRESEARYRAVVERSADAIAILKDGQTVFANHAFLDLHGLESVDEVTVPDAAALERFVAPADRVRVQDLLRVQRLSEAAATFEYQALRGDGETRSVEASTVPITHDRQPAMLIMLRDISERRALERMREEFVSAVTHELRTPLTSMRGYADLLLEGAVGDLTEEQRGFVEVLRSNAERLATLTNDLLDLSRIEAGKFTLRREMVALAPLIGGVARALQPQVETKGQRLVVDCAPDLPDVWADPDRVTQILTNLLSNAHKYTPEGGTISVAARRDGGEVDVEVTDTGVGLSEADQVRLFTKFFRAESATTWQALGTGLGLAITRSLVELHGGAIHVRSAPGKGSTFRFTLPAQPPGDEERS